MVCTNKNLLNSYYSVEKKNTKIFVDLKAAKQSGIPDNDCKILLALIAVYEIQGLDNLINNMKIELEKRNIDYHNIERNNDGNVRNFGTIDIKKDFYDAPRKEDERNRKYAKLGYITGSKYDDLYKKRIDKRLSKLEKGQVKESTYDSLLDDIINC